MATATYTKYRKRRYKEAALLISIELNPDKILYISDQYRTVTNYYEGLLVNVSGMDEYLPIDGRFKKRGDARIKLANRKLNFQTTGTDKFSDLQATYSLAGAKVIIKQYFKGCALTDCETIYTGKIASPPKYDEKYITLTVTPHKNYPLIPQDYLVTDAANTDGFDNLEDTSVGAVFPVVWGKMDNSTTAASGIDLTSYGGALKLLHELDTTNHYWLLAGHNCKAVSEVAGDDVAYDNNVADQVIFTGDGNAGGPSWRTLAYLVPIGWTVTIGEDTVNVHGMESYGDLADDPSAGILLENPMSCLEQTMRIFLPLTDADFGTSFSDTSDCDDLKCWGTLTSQYSLENLATLFMHNFPIWLYYGRDGKLEYKRHTFDPAVTYTERTLSYDDDIKLMGVELTSDCYNAITVKYWKNYGRDIGAVHGNPSDYKDSTGWHFRHQTVSAGGGDYLTNAFIKVRVQYSGKLTAEAVDISETDITIDTGGTDPHTAPPHELVLIDKELMEVDTYNDGTGVMTVYRREACGTDATTHADNTPIYYMHIHSANGTYSRDQQMEYTGTAANDDTFYVDEGGGAAAAIDVSGYTATRYMRDPDRLAAAVQTELNAAGALAGTYAVTWSGESGAFTISCDTDFFVDYSNCDNLAEIMGFTEDSANGTSCTSDSPPYTREAQAAYSYATHGVNRTLEISGDLIRGETMETLYASDAGQCDTAVAIRNHWFDLKFRPKKRMRFRSSLVLADLELADIVEFNTDIDTHLKCHGASWSGLKWRVIDIHRPAMHVLEFLVEEV